MLVQEMVKYEKAVEQEIQQVRPGWRDTTAKSYALLCSLLARIWRGQSVVFSAHAAVSACARLRSQILFLTCFSSQAKNSSAIARLSEGEVSAMVQAQLDELKDQQVRHPRNKCAQGLISRAPFPVCSSSAMTDFLSLCPSLRPSLPRRTSATRRRRPRPACARWRRWSATCRRAKAASRSSAPLSARREPPQHNHAAAPLAPARSRRKALFCGVLGQITAALNVL